MQSIQIINSIESIHKTKTFSFIKKCNDYFETTSNYLNFKQCKIKQFEMIQSVMTTHSLC